MGTTDREAPRHRGSEGTGPEAVLSRGNRRLAYGADPLPNGQSFSTLKRQGRLEKRRPSTPARHKEPGSDQKHRRAALLPANPQFMGVTESRLPVRGGRGGAGEAGQCGAVQMAAERRS